LDIDRNPGENENSECAQIDIDTCKSPENRSANQQDNSKAASDIQTDLVRSKQTILKR
jgi:hypothetical protein